MAHHVLSHIHRNELLAVVHSDGVSHELGEYGRTPRPGLHNLLVVGRVERFDLDAQVRIYKRTLFGRTCHKSPLPLLLPAADDEGVGPLVVACLVAARWLAPRGHRMTAARSLAFAAAVRVVDRVH